MHKKTGSIVGMVIASGIGLLVGYYLHFPTTKKTGISSQESRQKPLYWIDPMEPNVHYPGPGKSHMGMTLEPVYPEPSQQAIAPGAIKISPAVVDNLGIRIAPVTQGTLARDIETVGYVEPNENQISHIHTYTDGWIRNLVVKTTGASVHKGQLLFQLYSPMVVTAEEEYLLAIASKNTSLIAASQQRLKALGVSEQQIHALKTTHKASQLINVYAPQNGIVSALNVREGMRVTPELEVMSLTDLSTVWVQAEVYANQAGWVKVGQPAIARFTALPGQKWQGQVEYVYPQVDPITRTLKVRVRFDNPNDMLKPNMYATITLLVGAKLHVLSIPKEALIRGTDSDHVIVALGNGQFAPRTVVAGFESDDRIEILSGLSVGEKVVVSGQFLLDSESNLKASLQRLDATQPQQNASQPASSGTQP